jgi:hypothetical protein
MKASDKKSGLRPALTLQVRVAYESDGTSSKAECDNQALMAGSHAAALAEWARIFARVLIRADRAGQLAAHPKRNDFAAASPMSSIPDANDVGCSRRIRVRTSHRQPYCALEGAKATSRGEFQ